MHTTLINWSTIHLHGPLWFNHHKLRKQVFVDEMGWDVPHSEIVEWDQYDTPITTYAVTHLGERVIAATRIVPCSLDLPYGSYMIKDATKGRLGHIPREIIDEVSSSPHDYEITRFTVDQQLPSEERNAALEACSRRVMEYLESVGAERVFALMPPGFIGWFRKIGVKARRAGPTVENDLGERFCVLEGRAPFVAAARAGKAKQTEAAA